MSLVSYGYGLAPASGGSRVVRNVDLEISNGALDVTLDGRGLDVLLTPAKNLIVLSNEHTAFLEQSGQIAATTRQFDLTLTSRRYT